MLGSKRKSEGSMPCHCGQVSVRLAPPAGTDPGQILPERRWTPSEPAPPLRFTGEEGKQCFSRFSQERANMCRVVTGVQDTHLPTSSTLVDTRRTASHTSSEPWTPQNMPRQAVACADNRGSFMHCDATNAWYPEQEHRTPPQQNTPWVVQLVLVSAALDRHEGERGHAAHEHGQSKDGRLRAHNVGARRHSPNTVVFRVNSCYD
jgi:hypothetical protein